MHRPQLHVQDILRWADAHRRRTGQWPQNDSGPVVDALHEKWTNIDQALRKGFRGLPGNWSLPQLLAEYRGHRNRKRLPKYTLRQILRWADAHRERTGRWPMGASGKIVDAPGETWRAVDMALSHGRRGLPGGSSLALLLAKRRGIRHRLYVPTLSVGQILAWADAHRRRTGDWPIAESGAIPRSGGETWMAIDQALKAGSRGLRARSSLFKLLLKHRDVKRHARRQRASV